ncbi:MAG: VWA domain-containing protein [Bacteriovoracia bacterium]
MTFRYLYALLLIFPIALLLFVALRHPASRAVLQFPTAHRRLKLALGQLLLPIWFPFFLRLLGILFLLIALARPQTSTSHQRRISEGIDVMVALDVSQSMTIEDVGEDDKNRLDLAKETVKKFIAGRKDDRIGFLVFSGEAITLCPPTLDYDYLLSSVAQADVNQLKDGTAIGDAMATSVNRLKDSAAKSRVVILITDGDNNMGSIAPLTAGEIAVGYGIKIYAIALGKEGLVSYPDYVTFFGVTKKIHRQTNSTINPTLLMKIAEETGGKFFRADDSDSMQRVFDEINKLERNQVETKDRVIWEEHFQKFLVIAFALLLLDLLIRATIFRILPE